MKKHQEHQDGPTEAKPSVVSRWRVPSDVAKKKPNEEKITAGVPLAKVIQRKLARVPELAVLTQSRSLVAEKFRRLKTVLERQGDDGPQAIVVTSSSPNEGKTVVSTNLALVFAAEKRGDVLLIDADLRRPSIHNWLTPAPLLGLSDVLAGRTELDHVILSLENSPLKILPAGSLPHEPVELLSSEAAKQMFSTLRQKFSRIIVDTPPSVPFSDADILDSLCDGTLLVARSGQTEKASYKQAQSMMTSNRVLGLVLNDIGFALADWNLRSRSSYYAYYDENPKK